MSVVTRRPSHRDPYLDDFVRTVIVPALVDRWFHDATEEPVRHDAGRQKLAKG